jgi:amino acid adenylation domain-containing protein
MNKREQTQAENKRGEPIGSNATPSPESYLNSEQSYWKQKLSGRLSALDLPLDRPRRLQRSLQRGDRSFRLNDETSAALRQLAASKGVDLSVLLLAAFDALLFRYTAQEDLLVASVVPSSPQPASSVASRLAALRTSVSGDASFANFLGQVNQVVAEARAHASLTFDQVVEQVEPGVDRASLTQVLFTFRPAGVSTQAAESECGVTDLSLAIEEQEADGLGVHANFNAALFEPETIERFNGHLQILLNGILQNPDETIGRLPLLGELERHEVLEQFNETATRYARDKCIHQLFEEQVRRTPDAIAVICQGQPLTYRELDEKANRLARTLRQLGVGPDRRVGVCLLRSLEMVIALYAIHKAGGAYVPMDPTYPAERLAFMLEDAQVTLLLTQKALEALVPSGQTRQLCVDAPVEPAHSGASPVADHESASGVTPDHLAYLIYTSGSTGKPKGVMVQHGNAVNLFAGMDQILDGPPGTWLAVTSISFDISVVELFWTLTRGYKVILQPDEPATLRKLAGAGLAMPAGRESLTVGEQIRRYQVTNLQCTPSLAAMMMDDPSTADAFHLVKTFIFGGEPLPPSLVERLAGCGEVINMYGPTETTVWSTIFHVTRNGGRISIGRPIANTRLYILDRFGQPVPIGVPGELFIGGAGVVRGYLNRPELTAERFTPDPFNHEPGARMYRTGDLARYRADGSVDFLGRLDHQVKVRGYRIELGEIETALRQQPGVKESAVSVWQAGPNDTRLIGYFVAKPGETPQARELRNALKSTLPEFMVPSMLTPLEKLPLTPNGKVDRKALPIPKLPASTEPVGATPSSATPSVLKARHTGPKGRGAKTLPLTESQREIWLGAQVSKEISCSFNQSVMVRLRGRLEVQGLVDSLQGLVDRHEALRVIVGTSGQEQQVRPDVPVEVDFIDLSGLPEGGAQAEIERLLRAETTRPFDLANGPLFRARLARLSQEDHALFLTLHHIICDGGSVAVLLSDFGLGYSARVHGTSPPPPLEKSYSQFVEEQVAALQGGNRAQCEQFWLEQYSRPAARLALPTDRPRPTKRKYTGASEVMALSPALSGELKRFSAQQRCSLMATLLAGYYVMLQRLSGQPEVVIGLPIAARAGLGDDQLVGHCVNFLPLRLSCDGDPMFAEHLGRVWTMLIQALEHHNFTLGTLLQKLDGAKEHSRTRLASVMFNLDWVQETIKLPGLLAEVQQNPYHYERFDLSLGVAESGNRLEVSFQYSTELFDAETIKRWLKHYELLVSAFVANPSRPLSQYPKLERPDGQVEVAPTAAASVPGGPAHSAPETAPAAAISEAPSTATEKKLAEIWQEVVVLEQVGRHDSFFDIGGHSLLATKVISRITKTFSVELPVRVIFEAPTIAELAEAITRAQTEQPKPMAPTIGRRSRDSETKKLLARLAQLSKSELQTLLRDSQDTPHEP